MRLIAAFLIVLVSTLAAAPVPKAARRDATKIAGTTWLGRTDWSGGGGKEKDFEITFQADGVLVYHPDQKCNGHWKEVDGTITWDINNYSHYTGKIDGDAFSGTGTNGGNQRATFKFTLKKEKE